LSYLLSIVSAACYGFTIFSIHVGSRVDPVGSNKILVINLISGTFVLFSITVVTFLRNGMPPLTVQGILLFAAAGFSGPFLGRMFSIISIKHIGGTRTSTLRMGETFLTMILAYVILNERISLVSFVGAVILVAGIVVLIRERSLSVGSGVADAAGGTRSRLERNSKVPLFLFAFVAALFFSAGRVLHRLGLDDLPSPLIGALVGTLAALVTNSVFALVSGQLRGGFKFSRRGMLFFVLSGFGNSIGLLALMTALNRGGLLSLVVALKNTSPLFTLILGSVFLREIERVSARLVLSVLIVLAGAVLIVL
jgi:transporter family protein